MKLSMQIFSLLIQLKSFRVPFWIYYSKTQPSVKTSAKKFFYKKWIESSGHWLLLGSKIFFKPKEGG